MFNSLIFSIMRTFNALIAAILVAVLPVDLNAQNESVYQRGATYMEGTMPPSPEPASAVKYVDIPFSHSCGFAEYEVPFYTLKGRELSVPIALQYTSGGIKLDEIAGVAGLGWNLQAGGCITRTVIDMPDEFSAADFRHELPSGEVLDSLEAMANTTASMAYLRDVLWHRVDGQLDRYSYNVCGLQGSFVIQDDGSIFQLSGDGVKIGMTYASDGSVDKFTLIGPDGTRYILSEKEVATHVGTTGAMTTPTSGQPDRWTATTAWHITEIRSCSGLETATFTYSQPVVWKRVVMALSRTLSIVKGGTVPTPSLSTSATYIHNDYETKVLTGITLGNANATFTYSQGTGSCYRSDASVSQNNFPFRLTEISVRIAGNQSVLTQLHVGTSKDTYDGRIILNNLNLYRGEQLDDKWNFTYNSVGKIVSKGSQDWYGYYNGENEFTDDGNSTICPFEFNSTYYDADLTNGYPVPKYAQLMSLKTIDHDGAITSFLYEGNAMRTFTDTCHVGIRVKMMRLYNGLKVPQTRYFKYELPKASGPIEPVQDMYMTASCTLGISGFVEQCSWLLSLYDTPVTDGASIRDTRIYYGRVTEDIDPHQHLNLTLEPSDSTARTIYEFDTDGVHPTSWPVDIRFPSKWANYYSSNVVAPTSCSPWYGVRKFYNDNGTVRSPLIVRKEDYLFKNGAYTLAASTDYTYDNPSHNCILAGYKATQVMYFPTYGKLSYEDIYHYPIYITQHPSRNPVKTVRVNYHPSGNDTTVVNTSYVTRQDLSDPVRVLTIATNEAGVIHRELYGYADNRTNPESWVIELKNRHCLSVPLAKRWVVISAKALPTGGIWPIPADQVAKYDIYKEELIEYAWFNIKGADRLLPCSHVEKNRGTESWRETVLSRDCFGNITSVKEKGSPETVVLWGYGGLLPVAVIRNASISEVEAFFEDSETIDTFALDELPSQTYLDKLSELRNALSDSHVTTYTYIPGIGVSSETDPAGMTTYYEYDATGRLACVRDNDGGKAPRV